MSILAVLLGIGIMWLFVYKNKTTDNNPKSNKPTTKAEDVALGNKETARNDAEKQRKLDVPSSKTEESGDISSSKEDDDEDKQESQLDDGKQVDTTSSLSLEEKSTKVDSPIISIGKKVDSNSTLQTKFDTSNGLKSIPLKRKKLKNADIASTLETKMSDEKFSGTGNETKNAKANDLEEKAKKEIRANLQKADTVEFANDHVRASHLSLLTHEDLLTLQERVKATIEKLQSHLRNSMAFINNLTLLENIIKYTAPENPYKDLLEAWMQTDYRMYNSKEFVQIIQHKSIPMEELKEYIAQACLYYMLRVVKVKEITPRPDEYLEASLSKFANESFIDPEFKSEWIPMIVEFCSVSSLDEADSFVGRLKAHPFLKKHVIKGLKELKETNTSPNFFYKRILTSLSSPQ